MITTKKTVGETTVKSERISSKNAEHSATETAVMGSMSNEQVINLEDLKEAWMKFAEHCFYDSITEVWDLLPDPNEIRDFFDVEDIKYSLDAAKEAEKFYNEIADCDSMEDYEKIDFVGYIEDMMNTYYFTKDDIINYAIHNCGIDEEVVEVMVNVLKGE